MGFLKFSGGVIVTLVAELALFVFIVCSAQQYTPRTLSEIIA